MLPSSTQPQQWKSKLPRSINIYPGSYHIYQSIILSSWSELLHSVSFKRSPTARPPHSRRSRRIRRHLNCHDKREVAYNSWPAAPGVEPHAWAQREKINTVFTRFNNARRHQSSEKMYGSLDVDSGDVLHYSDNKRLTNRDPKIPTTSGSTTAMRRSAQLKRPFRILRSSGHHAGSNHGVSKGLRYDGLYTTTDVQTKHNDFDGAYLSFRLGRNAGQAGMDINRLTREELDHYSLIEQGYWE